jgi:hypothetical protein
MIDRIYLPVRCPGCHRMSVTSLPVRAAKSAVARGDLTLSCAFDCSEWSAAPAERERLQRLIEEHAVVASLPWVQLTSTASAHTHS